MIHRIYAVDLREDSQGIACVTEINGRKAYSPFLYTQGVINFSDLFLQYMLFEDTVAAEPATVTIGLEMVRGMDFEPLFRQPATGEQL